MERNDAAHCAGQRRGNLRILRVGDVLHAIDAVAVNRRVKGGGYLSCGSGEDDLAVVRGYLVDGETVDCQPCCDLLELRDTGAESCAELRRCEPLVIERRRWVLLGFDEDIELSLLRCGRLKLKDHAVKTRLGIDGTEVKLRACEWVSIAGESDELRLVQRRNESIHLAGGRTAGAAQSEKH